MEKQLQELCANHHAEYQGFREISGFHKILVSAENLHALLSELYQNDNLCCDFLQCLNAEHLPSQQPLIRMNYFLDSFRSRCKVHVLCSQPIPEDHALPEFPSVGGLWHTAFWHEREAAELFGIAFTGHPDLRKLLLPADWKGFPLRKDYQPEEKYHGLKIKYERE